MIGSPNQSNTLISSVTPLGSGVQETYDLQLKVTNDAGCWVTKTANVEV